MLRFSISRKELNNLQSSNRAATPEQPKRLMSVSDTPLPEETEADWNDSLFKSCLKVFDDGVPKHAQDFLIRLTKCSPETAKAILADTSPIQTRTTSTSLVTQANAVRKRDGRIRTSEKSHHANSESSTAAKKRPRRSDRAASIFDDDDDDNTTELPRRLSTRAPSGRRTRPQVNYAESVGAFTSDEEPPSLSARRPTTAMKDKDDPRNRSSPRAKCRMDLYPVKDPIRYVLPERDRTRPVGKYHRESLRLSFDDLGLQRVPCVNKQLKGYRCKACVQKQLDPCRFRTSRVLTNSLEPYGFYSDLTVDSFVYRKNHDFRRRQNERSPPDETVERYVKRRTAVAFSKIMREELSHVRRPGSVRRMKAEGRELCDLCHTTLFNACWMCSACGYEICLSCHNDDEKLPGKVCTKCTVHDDAEFILMYFFRLEELEKVAAQAAAAAASDVSTESARSGAGKASKDAPGFMDQNYSMETSYEEIDVPLNDVIGDPAPPPSRPPPPPRPPIPSPDSSYAPIPLDQRPPSRSPSRPKEIFTLDAFGFPKEDFEAPHVRFRAGEVTLEQFQEAWGRGQLVVVEGIRPQQDWTGRFFVEHFGDELVDVVNCRNFAEVQMPVGQFFEGFKYPERRLTEDGGRMCLKLKDWPSDLAFSEKFPEHFEDFINIIPFPEYTHPTGKYNLASYLPQFFNPPDLGPKMYNAYSANEIRPSERSGSIGTTCLHLDMADAVNLMVHIEQPSDSSVPIEISDDEEDSYSDADADAGSDRVDGARKNRDRHELPESVGATWDVFSNDDLAKVRSFIRQNITSTPPSNNFAASSRCSSSSTYPSTSPELEDYRASDPIHDQAIYLTTEHRRLLHELHGVKGWRVHQRPGDAIFVPAGSAHQVANTKSAVKVAMDFVSPEHVARSVTLTEEFRVLPRGHQRKKDLLQLKNILWCAWNAWEDR